MMSQREKRRHLLLGTFFLDVFLDRRTRPLFIYAAVVIAIGAAFYRWQEGWSWVDSFYFVVITLTTIGYGDLVPTKSITKLVTIFYGVNGIILLLLIFDVVRRVRGWDLPNVPREPRDRHDD
jgi:hypothetical protein